MYEAKIAEEHAQVEEAQKMAKKASVSAALAVASSSTDEKVPEIIMIPEGSEPRVAKRDEEGRVMRDDEGNIIFVPPRRNAEGGILQEEECHIVHVIVKRDAEGNPVVDKEGN